MARSSLTRPRPTPTVDTADAKPTVFCCSYPKSGTTWLQNIVATLASRGAELGHISDYTPFYEADSTWEKIDGGEPRGRDINLKFTGLTQNLGQL